MTPEVSEVQGRLGEFSRIILTGFSAMFSDNRDRIPLESTTPTMLERYILLCTRLTIHNPLQYYDAVASQ